MKLQLLLVDRDGVILEHIEPYILSKKDVQFIYGSIDALRIISENNIKIAVISNQSPINRNLINDSFVNETNKFIKDSLNLTDDEIKFYYCPHTSEDKCKCRKPNIGMLQQACTDFGIHPSNIWIVGDHDTDMIAGVNFNIINRIHLLSGRQKNKSVYATDVCRNLFDFVIKYRRLIKSK